MLRHRIEMRGISQISLSLAGALLLSGCSSQCCTPRTSAPCCAAPSVARAEPPSDPPHTCIPDPVLAPNAQGSMAAKSTEPRVLIEAAILRVPANRAAAILGTPRGETSRSMEVLPAADAAALLNRVMKDPAAKVLQMPSIVTESGQDAGIFIGESYDNAPHRPVNRTNGHEAALADPAWSGTDMHITSKTLVEPSALSMDLALVFRDMPPEGTAPDLCRLVAEQFHGRMGITRMSSGDSAVFVLSKPGCATGCDRLLLIATPHILPPNATSAR